MPTDRRAISRAAARGVLRIAEPRQGTHGSQNMNALAMAALLADEDEYDIFIWGRSRWGTHKWGAGGKFVWGSSKWGRQVWG